MVLNAYPHHCPRHGCSTTTTTTPPTPTPPTPTADGLWLWRSRPCPPPPRPAPLPHLPAPPAGDYIKYNSNSGFVQGDDLMRHTPQAFSHFTWSITRGFKICVDVQVRACV